MVYLRFVVSTQHPDSGVNSGLLQAAYDQRASEDTPEWLRAELARLIRWFEENLTAPQRFGRSSSKGHYRRRTRGISWFRDDALLHLAKAQELASLIEASGAAVERLVQRRVGYVVWQDQHQVVAEPFRETRTGN